MSNQDINHMEEVIIVTLPSSVLLQEFYDRSSSMYLGIGSGQYFFCCVVTSETVLFNENSFLCIINHDEQHESLWLSLIVYSS